MEKYKIVQEYKKNDFTYVGKCINNGKIYFYKKCLGTNTKNLCMLKNEIYNLKELEQIDEVPKICDYFVDNNVGIIIIEYLYGATLDKVCFSNNKEKLIIMLKILNAVEKIHSYNIVHCDLKLSNIFVLANGEIKIIDFGICSKVGLNKFHGYASCKHCAPELMFKENYYVNIQIDIFALGVILYWLFYNRFPYNGKTIEEIRDNKINKKYSPSKNLLLETILNKTLDPNPIKRYNNISEFKTALQELINIDENFGCLEY